MGRGAQGATHLVGSIERDDRNAGRRRKEDALLVHRSVAI
jgi:hypothetical protein